MKRQVIGLSLTVAVSMGMLPPMQTTARAEELPVTQEADVLLRDAETREDSITEQPVETETSGEQSDVHAELPSESEQTGETEVIPASGDTEEGKDFSLAVPQLTGISGIGTSITLQWNVLAGAEAYVVYRRSTTDAKWDRLGQVASTETQYEDNTAKRSKSYYYSVRAKQEKDGETVWSKRSESFLRVGRPKLKSAAEATSALKVRWYKVEGAVTYRIFRRMKSETEWEHIGDAKVNGYRDKTAKVNETYDYTVSAVCTNGETEFVSGYNKNGVSGQRVLCAPELTALSGTKTKVTLKWNGVSAAQSYLVERMEFGGAWKKLAITKELRYQDTGASTETTYYYRIRAAKKSGGKMIYGDAQNPEIQRPGATRLLGAQPSDSGWLIKWEAVSGVKDYRVYRRASQSEAWSLLATTSETYYQDDEMTSQRYWYTVRAVSQNPTTFYGAFDKNGVTEITQLATPELVKISNVSSGIRLQWNKVDYATGYFVYRRENAKEEWEKLKTIESGDKVRCVDKKAEAGKTYFYTVCAAYDGEVAGAYDPTGLVMQRIETPELKAAGKHKKGLRVTWNPLNYADGYYVYRRGSTSEKWEKIADVSGGATSTYVDSKVTNGKWYNYTIRAFCGDYRSGIVSEGKSYAYLEPVSITSIHHSKSQTVTVEWIKNPEAERYVISYATKADFSNAKTTSSATNRATLSGLTKGKVYYIRVNARKKVDGVKYFSRFSQKRAVAIEL